MRTILSLPVVALSLLFHTTVSASETTVDFVDEIVSGCMEWLNSDNETAFGDGWIISKNSAKDIEFANKFGVQQPHTLTYMSPGLSYVAIAYRHILTCTVTDNYLGFDETGAIASPRVEFDYQSARAASRAWGSERAGAIGFTDWLEQAELLLLTYRRDFIFLKKRCDEDFVTTITATADNDKILSDGLPGPGWIITVTQVSLSDENFEEYTLRACPPAS